MKKSFLLFTLTMIALNFGSAANAEETIVSPGVAALSTAIENASDGDTLILQDGDYSGTFNIDKSLTLRSMSRGAMVYIGGESFVVAGEGIKVTLQGLNFDTHLTVNQAADVRILENQFLAGHDIDVGNYQSSQGDGALAIIGNHFSAGSIISWVRSDNAYIAGNTFIGGSIHSDGGSIWIVGNDITALNGSRYAIQLSGIRGEAKVIANRVKINRNSGGLFFGVDIRNPLSLVSGNIVKLTSSFSSSYTGWDINGIYANGQAKIHNNLVNLETTRAIGSGSLGIYANSGTISGNIVDKFQKRPLHTNTGDIENNLCYSSGGSCGSSADGNLTSNPMFESLLSFKLSEGSPAIDTGPESPFYADIDRTRNDMGAYGGPWSIEQYDAQREETYFGPYVYPLFKANASISDGFINIRTLGVARLR